MPEEVVTQINAIQNEAEKRKALAYVVDKPESKGLDNSLPEMERMLREETARTLDFLVHALGERKRVLKERVDRLLHVNGRTDKVVQEEKHWANEREDIGFDPTMQDEGYSVTLEDLIAVKTQILNMKRTREKDSVLVAKDFSHGLGDDLQNLNFSMYDLAHSAPHRKLERFIGQLFEAEEDPF